MNSFVDRSSSFQSSNRGVNPQLGIVLLFVMVFVGTTLVFAVGMGALDALETQAYGEKSEQDLKQFNADLAAIGGDTTGSAYLGEQLDGELVTDGQLKITVSDGYVSDSSSTDLQTLAATDDGGNEFAYQAGGIWKVENDRATAVSTPNIRYYTETVGDEQVGRVDISPVSLQGNVGTGEHTVRERPDESDAFESLGEDLDYVNYVTVEVSETSYHHGWYDFLKDEFDATDESDAAHGCERSDSIDENVICHDESQQTVTVVAAVDGDAPLANLVDLEPTIYGGLYLEGEDGVFDSSLSVTAYDDHDADSNVNNDLFLANYDTYNLHNHADIEGIPVVNGELSSQGNPAVSPIGYGVTVDPGPRGEPFDTENNAYWLDAHEQALATELSQSYDDIDPIDDEIERLLTAYLADGSTASGDVTAGLYDGAASIDSVDSSAGDVHVGVDGDLDLSNVAVEGDNQTSFYVDGNVTLSDVEITPDDRADSLWIYASSDAEITIDGDFQGVVYAPGADLEIRDGASIDGAIVAGDGDEIGDDVEVNFDRSLRTDTPLSSDDEDLLFQYGESRAPLDATFVLDRSGSMGPHNPYDGNAYDPSEEIVIGESWEPIPTDEPFRNIDGHRMGGWRSSDVQLRAKDGATRTLEYREFANPTDWEEIRVHPDDHGGWFGENTATLGLYDHPGNDPEGVRVDATENFIDMMNESNGDRVGIYDFDRDGHVLHHLDGDLEEAKANVVGHADGGTNMAAGLELALDDYESYGEAGQENVTVLLSDGENNEDSDDDAMDEQVERANELGVTLHIVGLDGLEHDSIPEDDLRSWAAETGGSFYSTDDAEELFDLFETIAKEEVQVDAETQVEIAVTNERSTTGDYAISASERVIEIDS